MRTKIVVAILLLAIFAMSSITTVAIMPAKASPGGSSTLSLSDPELMLAEFTKEWGPGILAGKVDVAGPGVQFDFTGLQPASDTITGDNFPVNALAGGAYKDYGYGFSGPYDFSGYKQYCLCIENVGTEPVNVTLFMNTGWTVDWSSGQWKGPDGFGASPARDTAWRSNSVTIAPGECKAVCLDFSSATCYHAGDDPVLAWQHPDGTTGVPVQRLDEVSNIGFVVLGNDLGSIIVKGTQLYLDPPTVNKTPTDVGTTFDEYVTLENFANLAGFDIKLTWNSSLITETAVDYNTTLNALWGLGNWNVPIEQSGAGYYRLVAVALATSASNTGASVLFKITFHVDTSSAFPLSTPIHFESVNLSDNTVPVPKSICAIATDGMYYMSARAPLPEPTISVSPPVVQLARLDKTISVNVTISNLNVEDRAIGIQLRLWYNGTMLQLVNITEGPFMQDSRWCHHGTYFIHSNYVDPTLGAFVTIGILLLPNSSAKWDAFPYGNGTLATLTFKPLLQERGLEKPPLTCSFHITQYAIVDDSILSVICNAQDGTFNMLPTNICDLNFDYLVDMRDLGIAAAAFLTVPGDARWNPVADVYGSQRVPDGIIDMMDIGFIASNFGWTVVDP